EQPMGGAPGEIPPGGDAAGMIPGADGEAPPPDAPEISLTDLGLSGDDWSLEDFDAALEKYLSSNGLPPQAPDQDPEVNLSAAGAAMMVQIRSLLASAMEVGNG